MTIYIDITECKDSTGKVIAAQPNVGIQIDVNEGYDIYALRKLQDDLRLMLADKLQECIS